MGRMGVIENFSWPFSETSPYTETVRESRFINSFHEPLPALRSAAWPGKTEEAIRCFRRGATTISTPPDGMNWVHAGGPSGFSLLGLVYFQSRVARCRTASR